MDADTSNEKFPEIRKFCKSFKEGRQCAAVIHVASLYFWGQSTKIVLRRRDIKRIEHEIVAGLNMHNLNNFEEICGALNNHKSGELPAVVVLS